MNARQNFHPQCCIHQCSQSGILYTLRRKSKIGLTQIHFVHTLERRAHTHDHTYVLFQTERNETKRTESKEANLQF